MEYSEPKIGDSNNDYPGATNKGEGSEKADGMGLRRGVDGLNHFPGSEGQGEEDRLAREVARFEDLRSKAFGRDKAITNAGIPLDGFGGGFSE